MTYREVLRKIKDKSASDREVCKLLEDYLADKYNGKGNLMPLSKKEIENLVRLGDIAREFRPKVMEKLRKNFIKQHGPCCGKDPH